MFPYHFIQRDQPVGRELYRRLPRGGVQLQLHPAGRPRPQLLPQSPGKPGLIRGIYSTQ